MTPFKAILVLLGCACLIGAGTAAYYCRQKIDHRWTILEHPIRVEDGFSFSQPFTVEIPTGYRLEIECTDTIPPQELNAILMHQFAADFAITAGATRIAWGNCTSDYGSGSARDSITRIVGKFDAVPGQTYGLDFHVTHSFPRLAPTNPVVKIAVKPFLFEDAFRAATVYGGIALALGIGGIIFIVSGFSRRR